MRGGWLPRRSLVLLAALLFGVTVVPAFASSLGVAAADLTTATIPDGRCTQSSNVTPTRVNALTDLTYYDSVSVTNTPTSCAGKMAQVVVKGASNAVLAAGSATATGGQFLITLDQGVPIDSFDSIAFAISGWGINYTIINNGITYNLVPRNDDGTNYCADVTVTSTSTTLVTWSTDVDMSTAPINGTITSVSGAVYTFDATAHVLHASGTGANSQVSVSRTASFSFCATRGTPPPGVVNFATTINNDWNTGYCANVVVSTTSTTPITWSATIDLSQYPLNGTMYNISQATGSQTGPTLTAVGQTYNATVVAGSNVTWSFCANRPPPAVTGVVITTVSAPSTNQYSRCFNVTETTTSDSPITWTATVDLSPLASGMLTPWSLGNVWSAVKQPATTATVLVVKGQTYNATIGPGWSPAQWGFCIQHN